MFEALNYFVEKLIRIKVGPIELGSLPIGELRPLYQSEVMALKVAVGLAKPGKPGIERRPVITPKKSGGFNSRRSTYSNKPPSSSGARNRTPRSR